MRIPISAWTVKSGTEPGNVLEGISEEQGGFDQRKGVVSAERGEFFFSFFLSAEGFGQQEGFLFADARFFSAEAFLTSPRNGQSAPGACVHKQMARPQQVLT